MRLRLHGRTRGAVADRHRSPREDPDPSTGRGEPPLDGMVAEAPMDFSDPGRAAQFDRRKPGG